MNAFVEVTLKGEHPSPSQNGYLPLTKWTKPITWTLFGDAPPRIEQVISTALTRASVLTDGKVSARYVEPLVLRPQGGSFKSENIPIHRDTDAHIALHFDSKTKERPIITTYASGPRIVTAVANMTVFYGDRIFLAKIARTLPGQPKTLGDDIEKGRADCIAYTWTTKEMKDIAQALILIGDKLETPRLTKCLWEEIGQVLGIRNDFTNGSFSVFTNKFDQRFTQWTAFDENIIRMLYDSDLEVGMSSERVKAAARQACAKIFWRAATVTYHRWREASRMSLPGNGSAAVHSAAVADGDSFDDDMAACLVAESRSRQWTPSPRHLPA